MTNEELNAPIEQIDANGTGTIPNPEPIDEKDDLRDFIAKQFADKPATPEGGSVPRDESGKFAKAEGAEASDTPAPITDADEPQGKPEEQSRALEAPKGWSADAKAKWATLDPSIQAEVMRREQDMDNGGRQWSDEKRTYEQTLAPLADFGQKYGLDKGTALNRLLEWQRALEENPRDAILQLAQASGVDLANPSNPQQPQGRPDPYVAQLHQTVSQIQQTLTAREEQEIKSQIDAFKSAPGHDYFDKVRGQMGVLMNANPSLTMEEAYQDAIWANKDVRAELLKQQSATADQKGKEAAQAAKSKAAAGVRGSGPTGAAPAAKKDYGDDTRALVADAYYGRL